GREHHPRGQPPGPVGECRRQPPGPEQVETDRSACLPPPVLRWAVAVRAEVSLGGSGGEAGPPIPRPSPRGAGGREERHIEPLWEGSVEQRPAALPAVARCPVAQVCKVYLSSLPPAPRGEGPGIGGERRAQRETLMW